MDGLSSPAPLSLYPRILEETILSHDDPKLPAKARRELRRESSSRRARPAEPSRNKVLLAHAMWVVLALLVLTFGIMIGVAYVREESKTQTASDTPNDTDGPLEAAPDQKPSSQSQSEESDRDRKPEREAKREAKREAEREAEREATREANRRDEERKAQERLEEDRMEAERQQAARMAAERQDAARKEAERQEVASQEPAHQQVDHGAASPPDAEQSAAGRDPIVVSPAIQKIHALLEGAARDQQLARASGLRKPASDALNGKLKEAWRFTRELKDHDQESRELLKMFIHNGQGGCQEVLAELARHRRPQEVMIIRARTQGLAVLAYEKTLKLKGEAVYTTGIAAKAWALHRIAVLSEAIAKHHSGVQASYTRLGRSYPLANLINKFTNKSHQALARLKAEYPDAAGSFPAIPGATAQPVVAPAVVRPK